MVNGIQGFSNLNVQMMSDMREKMFARLDPDGDGQIDLAELKAKAESTAETGDRFTRMLDDLTAADTNGDGLVSRDEFDQMPPPPPPPASGTREDLFDLLDTDGDGQIDLSELQAQAEKTGETDNRFTQLLERLTAADTNGDGIVSRDEFEQLAPAQEASSRFGRTHNQIYSKDSNLVDTGDTLGLVLDQVG